MARALTAGHKPGTWGLLADGSACMCLARRWDLCRRPAGLSQDFANFRAPIAVARAFFEENREPYTDALRDADRAWVEGRLDLSSMERLLGGLLARQLLDLHDIATGTSH